MLGRRRTMTPEARRVAGAAMTRNALILAQRLTVRTISSYVSIGTEPATLEMNDALAGRGVRVLLPVLQPDLDLDWCGYDGATGLVGGPRGLLEPEGSRLGPQAITEADLVVVPAVAVGRDGSRLGRGGGSYDRALARLDPGVPVVALLYDGELLDSVPAEPHDRRVTAVLTPDGHVDLPH